MSENGENKHEVTVTNCLSYKDVDWRDKKENYNENVENLYFNALFNLIFSSHKNEAIDVKHFPGVSGNMLRIYKPSDNVDYIISLDDYGDDDSDAHNLKVQEKLIRLKKLKKQKRQGQSLRLNDQNQSNLSYPDSERVSRSITIDKVEKTTSNGNLDIKKSCSYQLLRDGTVILRDINAYLEKLHSNTSSQYSHDDIPSDKIVDLDNLVELTDFLANLEIISY